jgi:hypothetical protein
MHRVPFLTPFLHFSLARQDATQTANTTLVGGQILGCYAATLPTIQLWSWMDCLHIRVPLLEPERSNASVVMKNAR